MRPELCLGHGFADAVNAAKNADVTVVVLGEPASDSGEASSRSEIGLPGDQLGLVQQIAATGKPCSGTVCHIRRPLCRT